MRGPATIIRPRIHGATGQQNPLKDAGASLRLAAVGAGAELPAAFLAAADRFDSAGAAEGCRAGAGAAESAGGRAQSKTGGTRCSAAETSGNERGAAGRALAPGEGSAAGVGGSAGAAEKAAHHCRRCPDV